MQWNILQEEIKHSESLSIFKSNLKKNLIKAPPYFYVGKRYLQILHTRIRTLSSALNEHLYAKNIASPVCSCGDIESNHHFLLACPRFNTIHITLMNNITRITSDVELNILLFGNTHLNETENSEIFLHVQQFIKESRRFA